MYETYNIVELEEEVIDLKKTYEQDRENALQAQKYLAKSELEYFKAKAALLERKLKN